jgi:peptidoglycan/xylan/chitin deacetylase (PgdA/CDA1 family)
MVLLGSLVACLFPVGTKGDTASTTVGSGSGHGGSVGTGTVSPEVEERRWDCSGMTGADPAPLGGRVALSFDDGPDADVTPRIVDTLRRNGVPATFFVLGERLSDPDTWPVVDDIVSDPLFDVANHSWSHPDLTGLSLADVEAEVVDTTDLMATFGVTPTFFRFPYGSTDCARRDLVADELGLRVAGWQVDSADWCYAAMGDEGVCTREDYWRVPEAYEADMRGWIVEQVVRFDGGVVLFHDIHDYTADSLDDVIADLRDRGFTFTSLDDLTAFPMLNAGTPADLPYLGEPCDPSADACWQVEFEAWCSSASDAGDGVCTLACEGLCPDRDGAATTFCATVPSDAGQCTSRAEGINQWCDAVPGTEAAWTERFVGASGEDDATVEACIPEAW